MVEWQAIRVLHAVCEEWAGAVVFPEDDGAGFTPHEVDCHAAAACNRPP